MRLSELKPGDQVPALTLTLEPERIKEYLEATEETSGHFADCSPGQIVPPTAVAGLAIAALFNNLEMPAGTIHTTQEIRWHRPAQIGQTLTAHVSVTRDSQRRNLRLMAVKLAISNANGETIMEGETGFILPPETPS